MESALEASTATGGRRRPPLAFIAFVGSVVLGADLLTKLAAVHALDGPSAARSSIDVLHGHLELVLRRNSGGAWSLLQDAPEVVRRPFFLIVSVLAIALVVQLYRRLETDQRAGQWGFALVLGGAVGNLVDRVRDASVVDFIHAHASWSGVDHEWPTFNVADVGICVGVALLVVGMVVRRRGAVGSG